MGSMLPYIQIALASGFSIVVANPRLLCHATAQRDMSALIYLVVDLFFFFLLIVSPL